MIDRHLLLDASLWPSPGQGDVPASPRVLMGLAKAAEGAGLFSLSIPPGTGAADHAECGVALAWIAAATRHIGLLSGVNILSEQPYFAARRIAALDRISSGRAGFILDAGAIGPDAMPPGRGQEYLQVLRSLWDGWADDAFVADKEAGVLIAPGHVRHINHEGRYFRVRGPLPLSRTPQGHPVLVLSRSTVAAHEAKENQVGLLLAEWFREGAADGFNILPPSFPLGAEAFFEQVVPELRRQGLFRLEYEEATLRGNLGLAPSSST